MPQYDYKCEVCQHTWEETQKMSDSKIEQCPECKELKAKRLISGGTSFKLIGGNWGNNGYSSNK